MKHIKALSRPQPANWWEVRQVVDLVFAALSQLLVLFTTISSASGGKEATEQQ